MTTPYELIESRLRSEMQKGQMHVTIRDIGRLAGGYTASGALSRSDLSRLSGLAVSLAIDKGLAQTSWDKAVAFGQNEPVEWNAQPTKEMDWDDAIPVKGTRAPSKADVVLDKFIDSVDIPGPSLPLAEDMIRYLEAVFQPDDNVGILASAFQNDEGKWIPNGKGMYDRTRAELVTAIREAKGDVGAVIGDSDEHGAWVRINPLDGQGAKDANVTAHRHTLIEADDQDLGTQLALIHELKLPCSAIVHSGGKSIHAIVRVDADSPSEYKKRVERLYEVCEANGLKVDKSCKNPSRLSRLPGTMRATRPQYVIEMAAGAKSWDEWENWIADMHDDLPNPEPLSLKFNDLPPLASPLIHGLLRRGHKMRITGPPKAGKSFLVMNLCISVAEGLEWLGFQCEQGRVLYVNMELDAPSCLHRFKAVYEALGLPGDNVHNIDIWNLRGHLPPLDKLASKLIRRAADKGYVMVVLDPIYKVLTGDENNAADMSKFCNQFDRICSALGASTVDAHHHSKGAQGGKRSMDRGSGSGVFTRDPDAILDVIELHVKPDVKVPLFQTSFQDAMMKAGVEPFDVEEDLWYKPDEALEVIITKHKDNEADLRATMDDVRQSVGDATGWRIDATLREFRPMKSRYVWFKYPVHSVDDGGPLSDCKADGEEPAWKAEAEAKKEAKKGGREAEIAVRKENIRAEIDRLGGLNKARAVDVASALKLSRKTIKEWIHSHMTKEFHVVDGIICKAGEIP